MSRPLLSAKDYNKKIGASEFQYLIDDSNGLVSIEQIPANLGDYYAREYYFIPSDNLDFICRAGAERPKVEILRRFVSGGRLLEIGPSTGEFAFLTKHAGFTPTVIEMDEKCAAFIRNNLGIETICTSDPAAALRDLADFDAICLWQVIEHVPEFWRLMEAMTARLRPGGVLVISTPNPESLQFRLFGKHWCHLDAPRHLYLIPKGWFTDFARAHGLEVAMSSTKTAVDRAWNEFGWVYSFRQFAPSSFHRLSDFAAKVVGAIFKKVEKSEGNGTSYTVVLRKPAAIS